MRRLWWTTTTVALLLVALIGLAAPAPASAQTASWFGQFYNNAFLLEPSSLTRTDSSIAFNWGLGSPGSGINADNFSVRWATDVSLSPGNYRFYALADDNVRVTFNYNQTVIDTFANSAVGQLMSGDVAVQTTGTYHIQVDYREAVDQAYVYVSWANLATNPSPPTFPINTGLGTGQWVAYYYANTSLSGDPAAILTLASPNFNTGSNSPVPSVPGTNWSARFTSVQNLPVGSYQVTLTADDGVRFYVNGAQLLNRFTGATGQPDSVAFNVPSTQTTLQIDFVQFAGDAYLTYTLNPTGVTGPTIPVTGGPFATARVIAGKLNVRAAPAVTAAVVTQVRFSEQYPVFGKSADGRWYLIDVFGTHGWASASFLRVDRPAAVPIVGADAQVPAPTIAPGTSGFIVTATPYSVVIRTGPSTTFNRLGTMSAGSTAQIIGRNADSTWWQINFNGIVGWSSAQFAVIQQNANINAIPVTG